jgi:molybdopterin-containing oxidoreductase family iron-sulfur binding subunit
MEKKYWKGVEELRNDPEFVRLKNNEFFEHLPVDEAIGRKADSNDATPRRDFLKFLGFGMAAATLAACEAPVKKSIPYLVKPEEIVPGIPNYYASTFFDGHDYCSVVVKTREGRPIKIEGNELSSVSKGGTHARVQASVLGLYNINRLAGPKKDSGDVKWADADQEIISRLAAASASGKKIRILTSTLISPSTKAVITEFAVKYPGTEVVTWDAVSFSGMIKANETYFGKAAIPTYRFDKADVIVSFGADFLANWISPVEHARQYAENRKLFGKKSMSRHYQFEPMMTLSGANADHRYKMKPTQHGAYVVSLYNKVAALAGAASAGSVNTPVEDGLNKAARDLWNSKGRALVVSRANDPNTQMVVNAINSLLGSYGSTIDIINHSNLRQGRDEQMTQLVSDMNAGTVDVLLIHHANPAYNYPDAAAFISGLKRVNTVISFSGIADETASLAKFNCPDHHYLEAWDDAEPVKGAFSLAQPTIKHLFNTRQMAESLMVWAGMPQADYYTFIREYWQKNLFSLQAGITSFEAFWTKSLQDGVFETARVVADAGTAVPAVDITAAASAAAVVKSSGLDVVLYEKTGIGNGSQANNPWLQELPDPVSRVCWDNYICMSPAFAKAQGLEQGNVVELKAGNKTVKGPVYLQPGMADDTLAVALGYGRTKAGKTADNLGFNAFVLAGLADGHIRYAATGVTISKTTDDDHILAATQTHHTMMGRAIVKETNLDAYLKDPKSGNPDVMLETYQGKKKATEVDLWATEKNPGFDKPNHFWGLSIDLNSCIGCGSCVIACQVENNVPVVGKDEIHKSREMHWIRIDRYYSSDTTRKSAEDSGMGKLDMLANMEVPSENPEVVFQPIMCQHCNHAPCETVCPVVATTHSMEGLNMMAYNRCVGTRYCANNCPYKVRRFNWFKYSDNAQFDYNMNDGLGKMVLNPDVVVRSRGVMEKCSMCVQRIQYGKLEAKKAGRRPKDGEINTACAQACPTHAITFGDYNDPASRLSAEAKDQRAYHVLEELNVQPSVYYQTKVRNKDTGAKA